MGLLQVDDRAPQHLYPNLEDRGYNEVHDVGAEDPAFAGNLTGGDRYRFVDVRARGELRSSVVD